MRPFWENLDKTNPNSAHYSILKTGREFSGMDALRDLFPEADADLLNFVLFSTSGVHGCYTTIEDAETYLAHNGGEEIEVTFLVVHPRLVALRYGNCSPKTQEDIDFLKELRANSHKIVARIGTKDPGSL